MNWHSFNEQQLLEALETGPDGLMQIDAEERLQLYGPNEIVREKKQPLVIKFLGQFKDFMILVLLGAAVLAGIMGEINDTIIILTIVFINAILGFVQEYRADRAIEALRSMAFPNATVFRDGKSRVIHAVELVPGDKVLLEAGQITPADLRLLEAHALSIHEASLTGESAEVKKHPRPLREENMPLGDRANMVFKGTYITNGRGVGIVVQTGMNTEMGRIARMLGHEESSTPLQKRMGDFGKKLSMVVVGVCLVLFVSGYLRGEDFLRLLLTSVSLAVAAIPESLPAVITISLALGAKRMVKRLALIRKLPAVEALGSVTYICTDKTGTLTQNKMQLEKLVITSNEEAANKELFFLNLALSNDVVLNEDGEVVGDTTEGAMYNYAVSHRYNKFSLLKQYPRVAEAPFDSLRRQMRTVHRYHDKYLLLAKGAVESLAQNAIFKSKREKDQLFREAELLASQGYRVIAHGYQILDILPSSGSVEEHQQKIHILGLTGITDPLRPEVKQAVADCYSAGIQPVMITGDHPETARNIARQIGILKPEDESRKDAVISGKVLENLSWDVFRSRVEKIRVYARVSPEQKLHIVKALQEQGHFVAVTGDGVNDAPALKSANIGVAMGITGTDVSKEAAHMILLDDNFATIAQAVREGRRIYDNIRKFIKYMLTANAGEIWVIFLASLVGLPIPLLPVHILWINLVTDGLPGLALSVERAEKDIMHRPPRDPNESIFEGIGIHILWVGLLMGAVVLATQSWALASDNLHWQTMVFNVLCLSQLGHVLAIRSEKQSFFKGIFSNRPLVGAVVLTAIAQLAVTYIPALQPIFKTQALSVKEFLIVSAVSSIVFFAVEVEKLIRRKRNYSP